MELAKLYRFPNDAERRRLWAWALKREFWEPSEHSRICGAHFISGCSLNYKCMLFQKLNRLIVSVQESR